MGKKKQTTTNTFSRLTDFDISLFKSGEHFRLYEKLGAHSDEENGIPGTFFAVWAPNAEAVSVIGNFNQWQPGIHALHPRWDQSGIWEGFHPGIGKGELYKYAILTREGELLQKADPMAFYAEVAPKTASVVWDHDYTWGDATWMQHRKTDASGKSKPMAVYEVHSGSWKRNPHDGYRSLHYTELADELVAYVADMGYTHVEFMPVMEHPFFGSWGYQITGYYAPTSRYGNPQEFMYLIDKFHQAGIGVILDWVPSHFPGDEHGLYKFDGSHLYEHADPKLGFHPDWQSYIFNYGRNEVKSFLISNALFWLDKFHVDGLRVDAVASMLYLDYSRKPGEWIPNSYGGRENLDAINFLKRFNEVVYEAYPDAVTVAEESTAWPGISRPTNMGGIGFGQKWMMGWMHDTLQFLKRDSVHRKFHHNEISFSMMYAFTENFMLPLSHDEVVYGKGSLLGRMPGDEWQRFANLRLLYAYQMTHPGTKLLFMGGEFGQHGEWNHDGSLEWHLLEQHYHQGVREMIKDLNALYKSRECLFVYPFDNRGFEWIDYGDYEHNTLVFFRKADQIAEGLLVVCNFTPGVLQHYRIGVPVAGTWKEVFNSDDHKYGGGGVKNSGGIPTTPTGMHGRNNSLELTIPPLATVILGLQ